MDLMIKKRLDNVKKINKAGCMIYEVMRQIDCHDSVMREYVERLQSLLLDLSKIEISMEHKINHLRDSM